MRLLSLVPTTHLTNIVGRYSLATIVASNAESYIALLAIMTSVAAVIAFFKHKVVRSIIIIACWRPFEQAQYIREMVSGGFAATVVCGTDTLHNVHEYGLQGVLCFLPLHILQVKPEHLSNRYVWLLMGVKLPRGCRYDADVTLLHNNNHYNASTDEPYLLDDVYMHPGGEVSVHEWGSYSRSAGLHSPGDRARVLRRHDFNGFPLRIAAPVGAYGAWYGGPYSAYVVDGRLTELDAGIRAGYAASSLLVQLLNATEEILCVELWGSTVHNSSMPLQLARGGAELAGAILRMLPARATVLDYVLPIWPFGVGFTYLAERESSSNMFVAPFSRRVWWCVLAVGLLLAGGLRATARRPEEAHGAVTSVLATFLQQDASAVPAGLSGRWVFTVVSCCAMLLHAYYTSAIVSAFMSAGSGGPHSLRELADSQYSIVSEDYEYMRNLFFDVETGWEDLEYLKRKKKLASNFYVSLEGGAGLVRGGSTAFHTEYNQLYPHLRTFSDDQLCKLSHVDTVPEVMTWITTSKHGQYTSTFKSVGLVLLERGLARRVVRRLRARRPPCRATMLAERVRFADIATLAAFTALGAGLAILMLGLEILVARYTQKKQPRRSKSVLDVDNDDVS